MVVVDSEHKTMPVPRHALLVSDNPASAPPRRVVTTADGTADVRLRPGSYTVESDRPVVFDGKAYQWTQTVRVTAGTDAVLELTIDNAEVESATSASSTAPLAADPSFLLPQWQGSVVAVWTPSSHGSGFLFDAKGLVATNQQIVGTATSVEVQLSSDVKVAGRVVAADSIRDVAVLWIDPTVTSSLRPLQLGCGETAKPSIAGGQELFTIGAPLRGQKEMTSGAVSRVEPNAIASDLSLPSGSAGGPVFTAGGAVVGLTTLLNDKNESRRRAARVVRVEDVCALAASAEMKMKEATPPDGTRLPVEPVRPFPVKALKEGAKRRAGSLNPYQMSSADFDVSFITPIHVYGAQYLSSQEVAGQRRSGSGRPAEQTVVHLPMDFGNWSEYVADFPPVLLIRVTPKMTQSFWTAVARGAARTQGVALPTVKHFKPGFSRMRVFCGDAEVPPIHPFRIEQRVSESEAIYEGLYAFDPAALGPHCESAKISLYSEKEPARTDTRPIDPRVLQQIWQDFAPYRD
jgi:hypothetical protein